MKLYQRIAQTFNAYLNCLNSNNKEWEVKHKNKIEELVENYLPSGSGFDNGTQFDFNNSKENKLIFCANFHHMDQNGMYDNWTYHEIIVTPNLTFGFDLKVTGKDKNGIKEYIREMFHTDLSKD